MILYYFPIAQNTVNKTVSDFFQRFKCLFMYVHIFYHFSIYLSDTSLGSGVQYKIIKKSVPLFYFDFGCRTFIESYATINMIIPITIGNTCHNWI